jgi:hypothetical protein
MNKLTVNYGRQTGFYGRSHESIGPCMPQKEVVCKENDSGGWTRRGTTSQAKGAGVHARGSAMMPRPIITSHSDKN